MHTGVPILNGEETIPLGRPVSKLNSWVFILLESWLAINNQSPFIENVISLGVFPPDEMFIGFFILIDPSLVLIIGKIII